MAKFKVIRKSSGRTVREYVTNERNGYVFITDVNLKEGVFSIYKLERKPKIYFCYLTLNYNPKKVLGRYGYFLSDFIDYDKVCEFGLEIR